MHTCKFNKKKKKPKEKVNLIKFIETKAPQLVKKKIVKRQARLWVLKKINKLTFLKKFKKNPPKLLQTQKKSKKKVKKIKRILKKPKRRVKKKLASMGVRRFAFKLYKYKFKLRKKLNFYNFNLF